MIPKIAHFYWGNSVMPFMRVLTILSFKKQNPDWEIRLYSPKILSSSLPWKTGEHTYSINAADYSHLLDDIPIVVDMTNYGFSNQLSEVRKSDIIRTYFLKEPGGLWSDMDIIYFKPINLDLNQEAYFCYSENGIHHIGFLLGAPGNKPFTQLFEVCKKSAPNSAYQAFGSDMYKRIIGSNFPYKNLSTNVVYPLIWGPVVSKLVENIEPNFPQETIGVHWYAASPIVGSYINKVTPESLDGLENTLLGKVIKWVL